MWYAHSSKVTEVLASELRRTKNVICVLQPTDLADNAHKTMINRFVAVQVNVLAKPMSPLVGRGCNADGDKQAYGRSVEGLPVSVQPMMSILWHA